MPQGEAAGVLAETLLALDVPMAERVQLAAAALRDVQPGPASWAVCCGGVWQWRAGVGVADSPSAVAVVVSVRGRRAASACAQARPFEYILGSIRG